MSEAVKVLDIEFADGMKQVVYKADYDGLYGIWQEKVRDYAALLDARLLMDAQNNKQYELIQRQKDLIEARDATIALLEGTVASQRENVDMLEKKNATLRGVLGRATAVLQELPTS